MTPPPSLLLEPEPGAWRGLVRPAETSARAFREQLGLPADRPIIMSGHQADLWHPGILAKLLAADAAARTADAASAWLVVDQDTNDPTTLRIPIERSAGLAVANWRLAPDELIPGGTPVAARSAIDPAPFDATPHPAVREDAAADIARALRNHAEEPTLARQLARATFDLLASLAPAPVPIFSTELHGTDLFAELLDRMRDDPRAVASTYNDACAAEPGAGVRPLAIREAAVELPLWRIRPGEPRMPVYSTHLEDIPPEQLAPRALLMTAIVRIAGCDLFIHGTGGAAYDRITERWTRTWLDRSLVPMAVASATRTLDLAHGPPPTDDQIAQARARAHSARHDPAVAGDQNAAAAKADLLDRIERAKNAGENPAPLFREMQTLLADYRKSAAGTIRKLESEAERLESQRGLAEIAGDRTWAFPLYPEPVLERLRDEINRALAGAPS